MLPQLSSTPEVNDFMQVAQRKPVPAPNWGDSRSSQSYLCTVRRGEIALHDLDIGGASGCFFVSFFDLEVCVCGRESK